MANHRIAPKLRQRGIKHMMASMSRGIRSKNGVNFFIADASYVDTNYINDIFNAILSM